MTVATGTGAQFPTLGASDYFYATLESSQGTQEIVKVTARSGDNLTIVRAQDGSTANSFGIGARIELRINAAATTDFLQSGTGAAIRNFRDKLRESVSVKDFGADPTGANSSNVQIQAAIDYVASLGGGVVEFENGGTYLVSGQILLKTNVSLRGNGCTVSVNPLNYTGGITQFWGVFTTVNIPTRPLLLWRLGTGVISFENIQIDGFTFLINRDGNVLTSDQMDVAEINIVRFEDARNCKVSNCKFIDGETFTNNNGAQVVLFVRSEMCEISSCITQNTTFVYIAESKQCVVSDNYIPVSVGTSIETVAGESHTISNIF
jgi:hypothetical protein